MKYLFCLLLVGASLGAVAQKIRFSDTTNKWSMLWIDAGDFVTEESSAGYGTDTIISGQSYHRLHSGVFGTTVGSLALREDTVANRIYFRFITPKFRMMNTDTIEHLFFDYNLRLGDKFVISYPGYWARLKVGDTGSLLLGTQVCKKWMMWVDSQDIFTTPRLNPYDFIEGLGPTSSPIWPVSSWSFEDVEQLRCFTNHGTRPLCSPKQKLYYGGGKSWPRYMSVDSFDNASSCTFQPVSVSNFSKAGAITIAPNPGGNEMRLSVPAAISSYTLKVYDASGRLMKSVAGTERAVPIGQYVGTACVYYYILQDARTGSRYTGRFVYR
jgi:hypothetical protein